MYIDDTPVERLEDDRLGRKDFVIRLAETISSWSREESLVIGVYGAWGSGKSSVLNMLRQALDARSTNGSSIDPIRVLTFDPWFFNSTEELLRSFLGALQKVSTSGAAKSQKKKLKEAFKEYADSLSFEPKISLLGGLLSFGGEVKGKGKHTATPESLRRELHALLSKVGGRVVVLMDNLDRLDPDEVLLVLKLVRLCSDFPRFTYVMAFDQERVVRSLQRKSIDPEYLAKIVQTDITLPRVDQALIDDFVGKAIVEIANAAGIRLEDDIWQRFVDVYQSAIKGTLVADLRTAKRYVNALAFSLPLAKDEVNFADFLGLECIRVFFPAVYQELPNYENELTSLDSPGLEDWSRKKRFGVFKGLVDSLETLDAKGDDQHDKGRRQSLEAVLARLFPIFGAYLAKPENPTYLMASQHGPAFEREMRLCSSAHFATYFRLRVPSSEIPTSVVRQFLQNLNEASENDVDKVVLVLRAYKIKGQLVKFIQKTALYMEDVTNDGKGKLREAVVRVAPELGWERRDIFLSEARAAVLLVVDHLIEKANASLASEQLVDVVRKCHSLSIAAEIVLLVDPSKETRKGPKEIRFEDLVEALRERVQAEVVEARRSLFKDYPESHLPILEAWRSKTVLNDESGCQKYVSELLRSSPDAVVQILADFVWISLPSGDPAQFGYSDLKARYNVDEIHDALEALPGTARNDPIESFAIRKFTQFYAAS